MADGTANYIMPDGSEQDAAGLREKIEYWSAHAGDPTDDGRRCAELMKAVEFVRGRAKDMGLAERLRDDAADRMSADEFKAWILNPDNDPLGDGDIRDAVNSERLVALRGGTALDDDAIARFAAVCVVAERDRYGMPIETARGAAQASAFENVQDGAILDWICTNEAVEKDDSQKRDPDDAPVLDGEDLGPGAPKRDGPARDGAAQQPGNHRPGPVEGAAFDGSGLKPGEFRKQIEYWDAMKDEDTDEGRACAAMMEALEFGRVRIKGARLQERTAPDAQEKMKPKWFKACILTAHEDGPGKGDIREFLNSETLVKKRGRALSDEEIAAWAAEAAVAERDRYGVPDSVSDGDMLGMTAPVQDGAPQQPGQAQPGSGSVSEDRQAAGGGASDRRRRCVEGSPVHNAAVRQVMELAEQGYIGMRTAEQYVIVHTVLDVMDRNMRAYTSDAATDYLLRPGSSFADRKIARQLKRTTQDYARSLAEIRQASMELEIGIGRSALGRPADTEKSGPRPGRASVLKNFVESTAEKAAAHVRKGPSDAGTFTRNMPGNAEDAGAGIREELDRAAKENAEAPDPAPAAAAAAYAETVSTAPDPVRPPLHKRFGQFFQGMRDSAASALGKFRQNGRDKIPGPEDAYDEPVQDGKPEGPAGEIHEEAYDEEAAAEFAHGRSVPEEYKYDEAFDDTGVSAEDFYDEEEPDALAEPEKDGAEEPVPVREHDAEGTENPFQPVPAPAPEPVPEPGRVMSGEELYELAMQRSGAMADAARHGGEAVEKAAAAADEVQEKLVQAYGGHESRMDAAAEIAEAAAKAQLAELKPERSAAMKEAFARMKFWGRRPGMDGPGADRDMPGA